MGGGKTIGQIDVKEMLTFIRGVIVCAHSHFSDVLSSDVPSKEH